MSKNFVQNELLRSAILATYRLYARAQVWRTGPRIFVNSIPKAGTHLLTAELDRFASLQNSRLHLQAHRLNRHGDGRPAESFDLDVAAALRIVDHVRAGQVFTAHLFHSPEFAAGLRARDIRSIFMVRDPRDILVSNLHYINGLRRHRWHKLFASQPDDEARLRLLVDGHDGDPFIRPITAGWERFSGWLDEPDTLLIRFEDLVGARGGGTAEAKHVALARICAHAGLSTARLAEQAQSPTGATTTLRKGQANAWRDSLPPPIVDLVHARMGPLIERFGYSTD